MKEKDQKSVFYLIFNKPTCIYIIIISLFQGGVVLVSHDERLIRKICSELWVVSQGSVRSLEGGIDEYKALVQAELDLS